MSETVIYCEGYHDRAFWKGWLTHLGCIDPGAPTGGKTTRSPVYDPWNTLVARGQFAYHSRSGQFIRVVPCDGKTKILPLARTRLGQLAFKPLLRLVINIDPDVSAAGSSGATGLKLVDILQLATAFDPTAAVDADGSIGLQGGKTRLSLARWETQDPPTPGLPDQQTLERLVCGALAAAYPGRGQAIQAWLNARPQPPAPDPKEYAWSHMAGWYADHGCEFFYSHLWSDAHIVRELETRLRASGAWHIAETIAQ